jgi:hypothetical protein
VVDVETVERDPQQITTVAHVACEGMVSLEANISHAGPRVLDKAAHGDMKVNEIVEHA